MQRQTEYRSHYVGARSASSTAGRPRVATGRTMSASKEANQFHLRKSASDMLSATAVAIPTARTHRSPKKTVFTRTTYSVVRTPNVSAVHNDPYAALPSTDISATRGFARSNTAVYRPPSARPRGQATPPPPRAASANHRDRVIQNKMDAVLAKNRELEMQLLHLRREMMMVKAASTSSSRLNPPPPKRTMCRAAPQASASVDTHNYSQRPALISPRRPNMSIEQSRALHLVDELRDALAHSSTAVDASVPKKRKKHPKKKLQQAVSGNSADMLRSAIYEEQRQYGTTSRVRSPQKSTGMHNSIGQKFETDDDDGFESLQRSYWSQSQAILDQLDRKLREITVH